VRFLDRVADGGEAFIIERNGNGKRAWCHCRVFSDIPLPGLAMK